MAAWVIGALQKVNDAEGVTAYQGATAQRSPSTVANAWLVAPR